MENLTVFERIVVEILRAVILGHRLIVLCEVSAMISRAELEKLHEIIRHYAEQGFSFLYISLHYEEILQICNRAAFLTHGRIQPEMERGILKNGTEEYNQMVLGHLKSSRGFSENKRAVLSFREASCNGLENLSFEIIEGECLVLQSFSHGVFQTLVGLLKEEEDMTGGCILMEGKEVAFRNNKNIAVLQDQPTKTMIFPELNNMDNLCFGLSRRVSRIWSSQKIRDSIRQEYGKELGEDFFSLYPDQLSERQKCRLIYTRILLQRPKVVFCIQPFKGADLPHRMFIWKMLTMLLDKKIAVVILAVNMADSISLADRLLYINASGVTEEIARSAFGKLPAIVPWQYLYEEDGL